MEYHQTERRKKQFQINGVTCSNAHFIYIVRQTQIQHFLSRKKENERDAMGEERVDGTVLK